MMKPKGIVMSIVLLDSAGVAEKLKLKKSTPEGWAYGRKTPPAGFPSPIKVSNRLRWREDQIDTWLISQSSDGSTPAPVTPAAPTKRGRGRPRKAQPTLRQVQEGGAA